MNIQLVLSLGPRDIRADEWVAPASASVHMALAHLQTICPDWQWDPVHWHVAIWGQPSHPQQLLKHTDRLEVLRGLRVDPKVARRERFQKQGSRSAGLFAKRRAGAKPGY